MTDLSTLPDSDRPRLHFTPPYGWMNDPNGLIRAGDTYHLFYQHNPADIVWGNIHWGHATSQDLITWTHQPIALAPDQHGMIFSGTVVIDEDATVGPTQGSMVAVFTHDLHGRQRQSLAFSTDGGISWSKYQGNPVLEGPEDEHDYRDPKVFRFGSNGSSWWVMVLAVGTSIWLYRSENLIDWVPASQLALPSPWPGGIVEVAELVRVPMSDSSGAHWTLIWSVHIPSSAGSVQTVCWLRGDFDGETFTPIGPPQRFDAGTDLYAVMAWDLDGEPPISVGWMNDRRADSGQRRRWCGRLSLARRIVYRSAGGDLHLTQEAVLPQLGRTPEAQPLSGGTEVSIDSNSFALELAIPIPEGSEETCVVVEDRATGTLLAALFVSSNSCRVRLADASDAWIGRPLFSASELDVTVVIDCGSVELFADAGRVAVSKILPLSVLDVRLRTEAWATPTEGTFRLRDFETLAPRPDS